MAYFSITALLCLLCLVNLLLMLGIVRRLRDHESRIQEMSMQRGPDWHPIDPIPSVGESIEEFTAETVDGAAIDHRSVFGATAVFLDANCDSCHDRIPEIAQWAKGGERARIFAFVNGQDEEKAEIIAALNPVTQVVSDTFQLHVTKSFRVRKFPAYLALDNRGTITAAGEDFHTLFQSSAS
jgi:hypothetical protein